MSQALTSLPSKYSDNQILCGYVNATNQIQIVRITNIANWYFERVVFPGQRLMFESFPNAQLEVHTSEMASVILLNTILCDRLSVSASTASAEQ